MKATWMSEPEDLVTDDDHWAPNQFSLFQKTAKQWRNRSADAWDPETAQPIIVNGYLSTPLMYTSDH